MRVLPLAAFTLFIFTLVGGCASKNHLASPESGGTLRDYDHVYNSQFTRVWRAVQLSIPTRYSLSVNQMETGLIETDWISIVDGYEVPFQKKKSSVGTRYKLMVTLVRGKSTQQAESIRVIIRKQIERKGDFFSEPEPLVSDGLEERAILYRVGRELVIEQAILKSQSQKPPRTSP